MDRQIPIGNRSVHLYEYQRYHHKRNSLSYIQYANFTNLKSNHSYSKRKIQSPTNIETMRQNAYLFEKVNSIMMRPNKIIQQVIKHKKKIDTKLNQIRQQNIQLYKRIVEKKPTVCIKKMIDQRMQNVDYLKRIGRYPYKESVKRNQPSERFPTEGEESDNLKRGNTLPEVRNSLQKISKNEITVISAKKQQSSIFPSIILWQGQVRLARQKLLFRFIRLQDSYQLRGQSNRNGVFVTHRLVLDEEKGTALLTDNDYDYGYLCGCLKWLGGNLCLSYCRQNEKKQIFYKFNKQEQKVEILGPHRKTMFAIENEKDK